MKTSKIALIVIIFIGLISGVAHAGTPYITKPNPGSTLSGDTVTFEWTDTESGYWLHVGRSPKGSDIDKSGYLYNPRYTVDGLPTDGSPIYVTIYFSSDGENYGYIEEKYTTGKNIFYPIVIDFNALYPAWLAKLIAAQQRVIDNTWPDFTLYRLDACYAEVPPSEQEDYKAIRLQMVIKNIGGHKAGYTGNMKIKESTQLTHTINFGTYNGSKYVKPAKEYCVFSDTPLADKLDWSTTKEFKFPKSNIPSVVTIRVDRDSRYPYPLDSRNPGPDDKIEGEYRELNEGSDNYYPEIKIDLNNLRQCGNIL